MSYQKRYILTTLAPLLTLVAGATLWAALSVPLVPDPMAIHFDSNFLPDGYLAPTTSIVLFTSMNLLLLIIFTVLARNGMWHGITGRVIVGSSGFSSGMLSVLQIELFRLQRGLTDATQATLPATSFWFILLLAAVIGVLLTYLVQPVPQPEKSSKPAANPGIPHQGKAVWLRSESMHFGVQLVLVIAVMTALVCLIITPNWAIGLTTVITVTIALSTWGWRYRIDNQGFSYRSYLGFPRGHIPHQSIASAESIHVKAANWGGWGWRLNGSGTGFITKSGPGVRIMRTNGRVLEITSDDAPTAAGLLKHYVSQTTTKENS